MALPPLFPVTVRQTELVANGQVLLQIEAPKEILESHRIGGQYAFFQPTDDAKANPMALASPPGAAHIALLMKVPDDRVEATLALSGAGAKMSAAAGPGFPLDAAKGKDLLLCAVGSAIAPIRSALLGAIDRKDEWTRLSLLYGVRSDGDFAFGAEFDEAESGGVTVVRTLSRPEAEWKGPRGRVQAHLEALVPAPEKTVAFVCGMGPMQTEVKAALVELGVPEESIFFNF